MGGQKKIAQQIVKQGGEHVISLKGNQGKLHEKVEKAFPDSVAKEWEGVKHETCKTIEGGHGRIEKRRYDLMPATAVEIPTGWPTIQRVVIVERERSDWKKTSYQVQYYISLFCHFPKSIHTVKELQPFFDSSYYYYQKIEQSFSPQKF
jgi:predicted transposase YbfD/YdcC